MYSSNGLVKRKPQEGLPVSLPFGKHYSEQKQSQELLPRALFGEVTCWAFGCNKHFFRAYIMFQTHNSATLAGTMWQKPHAIMKMSCFTCNNIQAIFQGPLSVCTPLQQFMQFSKWFKIFFPCCMCRCWSHQFGGAQETGVSSSLFLLLRIIYFLAGFGKCFNV